MSDLPVDSGLRCPHCSYNLTSLTAARCPECGGSFVLVKPEVLEEWRNLRNQNFRHTPSMVCPKCFHTNLGFMPRTCGNCGVNFTWHQRIFGTKIQ